MFLFGVKTLLLFDQLTSLLESFHDLVFLNL